MSIYKNGAYLFISGLGVGYIMGMSISPVVGIVLASLITLVVSLSSALAGIGVKKLEHSAPEDSSILRRIEVNPLPIMALTVGIAFGGSFGIWMRTHAWLGTLNPGTQVETADQKATKQTDHKVRAGVFYGVTASQCNDLRSAPSETLLANINQWTDDANVKAIATKCPDADCRRSLVYIICKDN